MWEAVAPLISTCCFSSFVLSPCCGSGGWLDIALFCPGRVLPVPSRVYSAQTRYTWPRPPAPFCSFLAYIFLFCF